MTSKCSKPNIAVFSDIHLGHRQNEASFIIKNLYTALPDNVETHNLDIIFLAGDIFDNRLSLTERELLEIINWITYVLRICKKHDIILRILEGTPSHDWKQSKIFEILNTTSNINADAKYVDTLSIEYISKYNVNVLYVPDEWQPTTEKTYNQVLELLSDKNLVKVDYAVMHGQFEFQLPAFVKAPKHSSENYLSIVSEYIFIGHVHIFSTNSRIIAQGSFDRIAHNEEHPKGHVRIEYTGKNSVVRFIENKNARIYKSIDCCNLSVEDIYKKIDIELKDLPEDIFIRIVAEKSNPIFSSINTLIVKYPFVNWGKKIHDEKENEIQIVEDKDDIYIPITITKDNIVSLVMNRLKTNTTDDIYVLCEKFLNGAKA